MRQAADKWQRRRGRGSRDNDSDWWSGLLIWNALPCLIQLFTQNKNSLCASALPQADDDFINNNALPLTFRSCLEMLCETRHTVAYPPHQSTQFKGQRTLMNIWCKWSSSASNCCFNFFVPPLLQNWAEEMDSDLSPGLSALFLFIGPLQEQSRRRAKEEKETIQKKKIDI